MNGSSIIYYEYCFDTTYIEITFITNCFLRSYKNAKQRFTSANSTQIDIFGMSIIHHIITHQYCGLFRRDLQFTVYE